MADKKLSTAPEIIAADVVKTDKVMVLDRSAVSGDQSGPAGTWKQMEIEELMDFETIKGGVNSLDLTGIDTTLQTVYQYIAQAINAQGPFTAIAGEMWYFRTTTVTGPPLDPQIIINYYTLNSGILIAGGGALNDVAPGDVVLLGQNNFNPTDQPDLFIDLGDIGAGPVEDYFNTGQPAPNAGDPWEIIAGEEKFIKAILNGGENLWYWVGSPGSYGGTSEPQDPPALPADFLDLSAQPNGPPAVETKPVNMSADVADISIISLHNWEGSYYFTAAADNTIDTFSTTNHVTGGRAILLIDTTGKTQFPVISGGVASLGSDDFTADKTYILTLFFDGTAVHKSFKIVGYNPILEGRVAGKKSDISVAGVTSLNWLTYSLYELTLTAAATLTDSNLPTGESVKVMELVITGDFALTLPAYWEALPSNDLYDGTVRNLLIVSIISGDFGAEDVIYSLQNLAV